MGIINSDEMISENENEYFDLINKKIETTKVSSSSIPQKKNNVEKNKPIKYWKNVILHFLDKQNKLGISLNEYKHFNDIIIELIPIDKFINKQIFINLKENNDFNIYFDDTEVKRNFITENDFVSKIKVRLNPKNKSLR